MRIVHFSVEALHGYMSSDISFNEDLTIMIGPNGCGKTSILTLLSTLLRLDFTGLKRTKFSKAKLRLKDENIGDVELVATEVDEGFKEIKLTLLGETCVVTAVTGSSRRSIIGNWGRREEEPLVNTSIPPLVQSFKEALRLTFVKLDRTLSAVDSSGNRSAEGLPSFIDPSFSGVKDLLGQVGHVTQNKFLEYKRQIDSIRESTISKLVSLSFDPLSLNTPGRLNRKELTSKIQQLKKRIDSSSIISGDLGLNSHVSRFFDSFSSALEVLSDTQRDGNKRGRKTLQEESVRTLLQLKEKQIERLLEIFDEEKIQEARATNLILDYLREINKFFEESGKVIYFDELFNLRFDVMSGDTAVVKSAQLEDLSSGERQILILFTYLAFLTGNNSIFIVDEPELSLHLKWQAMLVGAVHELRPRGCQVVIATHAPEIAGRSRSHVVRLNTRFIEKTSDVSS